MEELDYWLALSLAPGIGVSHFHKLVHHFGSARNVLEKGLPEIITAGMFKADTIAALRQPAWPMVEQNITWANQENRHIVPFYDARYPPLLKEIPDPPLQLFIIGNPDTLWLKQIAMVGSRRPSHYGKEIARMLSRSLSRQGLAITSGLATGIDALCHKEALRAQQTTIAVIGCGLDKVYPRRHEQLSQAISDNGALVSEFPLGTPPLPAHFPKRNRIISGLSLATLVIEASLRSGSLITARMANEQGRDVFAVPGSIHSPLSRGCHKLIREGAKLIENIDDILEELLPVCQIRLREVKQNEQTPDHGVKSNINTDERKILHILEHEPVTIDTINLRTGIAVETISSLLLVLELQGKITSDNGCYYRNQDPGT